MLTSQLFSFRIFSVNYQPQNGVYDLEITNATYNRDNGQFECRVKEGGTGRVLHKKSIELTVLLQPSRPYISPQSVTAVEGKQMNLTCSSVGGSPPPQINWFNTGNGDQMLDAKVIRGKNKDEPTRSILTVMPTKADDGASYRCVVWNRALRQEQKLIAETRLSVNCE